jgi:hypothetical protein
MREFDDCWEVKVKKGLNKQKGSINAPFQLLKYISF